MHQIDASDGRIDEAEWRAIVEAWQMDRQEVLEETEDSLRNFILKDVALRNQAFVEHSQTYIGRKITMQDVQRQLILAGFPLPRE